MTFFDIDWTLLDLTCDNCVIRPMGCSKRTCDMLNKAKHDRYKLETLNSAFFNLGGSIEMFNNTPLLRMLQNVSNNGRQEKKIT